MNVTVSFPHTNPQFIPVMTCVEAVTEDTKETIVNKAKEIISKNDRFVFNDIDGFLVDSAKINIY